MEIRAMQFAFHAAVHDDRHRRRRFRKVTRADDDPVVRVAAGIEDGSVAHADFLASRFSLFRCFFEMPLGLRRMIWPDSVFPYRAPSCVANRWPGFAMNWRATRDHERSFQEGGAVTWELTSDSPRVFIIRLRGIGR